MDPLNLNIDITDVSTDFPSAAVGDHHVRITKAEVKAWSKSPGHSLVITVANVNDLQTTSGEVIPPGKFTAFYRLNLTETEGFDFRKNLARFSEAVFGTKMPINNEFIAALVGQEFIAIFKPSKDTTYGDTEIKGCKAVSA